MDGDQKKEYIFSHLHNHHHHTSSELSSSAFDFLLVSSPSTIATSHNLIINIFCHKSIASECRERGGTVIPVHCDHSNPEDVEELFKQIDDENGGQLDILVNSAFSATAVRCVFLYFSLNILFRT